MPKMRNIHTPTDVTLTVASTPGAGKKSHRRKRKRAEKTNTVTVKKRLVWTHLTAVTTFSE